ncbi:MAG: hypothetical protein V4590_10985 [Bacteroidota bacterium]
MKNLILITCLFMVSVVHAQTPKASIELGKKRGWIGISAGAAIPLGDFGSSSVFDEKAGLAKLGFALNADITVPFNSNIGAIFSLNGFINPTDEDAVKGFLALLYPGVTREVSMGAWKAGSLLAGFYAKSNGPDGRPSVYLKVQTGYALTASPEMSITLRSGSNYSTVKQNSGTAGAWVFNGGTGIMIPLNDGGPSVQIGVNFIMMKSDFEDVEATSEEKSGNAPVQKTTTTGDFSMTFSNLIVNAGLVWSLQ